MNICITCGSKSDVESKSDKETHYPCTSYCQAILEAWNLEPEPKPNLRQYYWNKVHGGKYR